MIEMGVFGLLIALGIWMRLLWTDVPNFAPVAAIALFSGFFFRRKTVAIAVPLLVMGISDLVVGGYELGVMLAVYGAFTLPVFMRPLLRDKVCSTDRPAMSSLVRIFGCVLAGSIGFFLITNFAVWLTWYEHSVAGLAVCYTAALPFLRYTAGGDLLFAVALFGSYALAVNWGCSSQKSAEPVIEVQ